MSPDASEGDPDPSDERVQEAVDGLDRAGVDLVCSVPCGIVDPIVRALPEEGVRHVPVTREEEGVGVCAGASLGGARPALLMQNSGLGNSINALLSLHRVYELPLFVLIGLRGGPDEDIVAQVPMGRATPDLLAVADIDHVVVPEEAGLGAIGDLAERAFDREAVTAVLLTEGVWS